MTYVDGFLVPVPIARLDDYKALAERAAQVWIEHGALSVVEAVGDNLIMGEVTSFPRAVQRKDDETAIFSWITYPSREARDETMKKVMEDPRMKPDMENMPFDGKRMIFGGFTTIVER